MRTNRLLMSESMNQKPRHVCKIICYFIKSFYECIDELSRTEFSFFNSVKFDDRSFSIEVFEI